MPDLLTICGTAFVSVFVLLGVLAALMRIIIGVYPARPEEMKTPEQAEPDQPVYAAIASAYSNHYPGTQITMIKEIQ